MDDDIIKIEVGKLGIKLREPENNC